MAAHNAAPCSLVTRWLEPIELARESSGGPRDAGVELLGSVVVAPQHRPWVVRRRRLDQRSRPPRRMIRVRRRRTGLRDQAGGRAVAVDGTAVHGRSNDPYWGHSSMTN